MSGRVVTIMAAVAMMLGLVFLRLVASAQSAGPQSAQVSSSDAKSKIAAKPWTFPRTPWGHPDLQGVWDYRTITPLERPSALSGKQFLTDDEAATFEREENRRQNRDLIDPAKGGLYGEEPSLTALDGTGNLKYAVDFRSVYQEILSGHLGADSKGILGAGFDTVHFLKSPVSAA